MRVGIGLVLVMVAACAPAVALAAPGTASGTLNYQGAEWKVADGIAYVRGEGKEAKTVVTFSSVPYDRRDFARDRVIDEDDLQAHWQRHPQARGFELRIPNAAREDFSIAHYYEGGASNGTSIPRSRTVKVGTGKGARASGAVVDPYDESGRVTFDVPVEGEVPPSVEYLPDDGGEPGVVVVAFMEARTQDQYARMASLIHPRREALLDPAKPAVSRFFRAAQRTTGCRNLIGFRGGYTYDDEALVAYGCQYGNEGERELRGVAVLARAGTAWRIVGFLTERIYE